MLCVVVLLNGISESRADSVNLGAGLVDHYKFDGDLNDSSGHGLGLSMNQPVRFVPDRFGEDNRAVQIATTGPNQPAFFGTGPNLANKSSSVTFWIRKDNLLSGSWLFGLGHRLGIGGADGKDMHVALDYGSSIRYSFFSKDFDSPNVLSNAVWYHLAFTYERSTGVRRMYVNGVQVGANVTSVPFTGGTNFFLGGFAGITLDDFRFYNRALNAEEVKQLAR